MSGDERGGLDEVGAGEAKSRRDISVRFSVWCLTGTCCESHQMGKSLVVMAVVEEGWTDETHQGSRPLTRNRVVVRSPPLVHLTNMIPLFINNAQVKSASEGARGQRLASRRALGSPHLWETVMANNFVTVPVSPNQNLDYHRKREIYTRKMDITQETGRHNTAWRSMTGDRTTSLERCVI